MSYDRQKLVVVLMSTYNGEKYIEKQIESILHQKWVMVKLIIRDDGSMDSTVDIINRRYSSDARVTLLSDINVGCEKSFSWLIYNAPKADYYAFADQDDVWLDDKLYNAVKKLETESQEQPLTYYSNLKVVDENLSFLFYKFKPGYVKNTKKQALGDICVWGCTCVFNSFALEKARLLLNQDSSICHEHSVWLVSLFLGKTVYDENSFILYRQHGDNLSGQVKTKGERLLYFIHRLFETRDMSPCFQPIARALLETFREQLDKEDRDILERISRYTDNKKYKLWLLFTTKINSYDILREISRRIRIINNKY